ncbi:MAG: hypothetical protein GEU86_16100 [Actinophytocola sp.]|nr:hypothetical protein [Actinophytocola sp.]
MTTMLPGLAAPVVGTAAFVLAQQPDNGGQGDDAGKASPVGLVLLILFLIAVVLLVRSMTKHLKRVPASFDTDTDSDTSADTGANDETSALTGEDDQPGNVEPGHDTSRRET